MKRSRRISRVMRKSLRSPLQSGFGCVFCREALHARTEDFLKASRGYQAQVKGKLMDATDVYLQQKAWAVESKKYNTRYNTTEQYKSRYHMIH